MCESMPLDQPKLPALNPTVNRLPRLDTTSILRGGHQGAAGSREARKIEVSALSAFPQILRRSYRVHVVYGGLLAEKSNSQQSCSRCCVEAGMPLAAALVIQGRKA